MMLKYNRVKPIRVPVHLKIPVPAPRPRPAFTLKISVPLLPRQGPSESRGPTLAKILYEISKSQISGLDFGFLSKISDFISLIKSVKIVDEKIRALFFESRFE